MSTSKIHLTVIKLNKLSFDGKNFTDLGIVANYAHSASQKDIANYKSQPMAVGGCFPPHDNCHKKAEIMRRVDQADRMWEEIEEYPVGSRYKNELIECL